MGKMSIQYSAPGFEPTTFQTWVFTHNLKTRASAHVSNMSFPFGLISKTVWSYYDRLYQLTIDLLRYREDF